MVGELIINTSKDGIPKPLLVVNQTPSAAADAPFQSKHRDSSTQTEPFGCRFPAQTPSIRLSSRVDTQGSPTVAGGTQ